MIFDITDQDIRKQIPNVAASARGEQTLRDKLGPFMATADNWLVENILGEFVPQPGTAEFRAAKNYIISAAMAKAVPSLDLALTGSGFTVFNSDGRAPASSDRVNRLITSLLDSADAALRSLNTALWFKDEWLDSYIGQWFSSTLLSNFGKAEQFRTTHNLGRVYDAFVRLREISADFEERAAITTLGFPLIEVIVSDQFNPERQRVAVIMFRAECDYIHRTLEGRRVSDQEFTRMLLPTVHALLQVASYKALWVDTQANSSFRNTKQGGFFF